MTRMRRGLTFGAATLAALLFADNGRAEQIVVSNYGIAANGMPYAVAMEKGFFKQEGADVTGILSSNGGGTTIRNLLGGNLNYGEVDLAGTVTAIEQGNDLHIISDNVLTVGEFVWAVKPDSPIKSLADFKGHKIGYTNPRSTSQALNVLLLQTIGLTQSDVSPTKVGGFGEQVVALDIGAIDVATLADPVWSKNSAKLRTVVRATGTLPPLCNVIGVATGKAIAEHGDFLRAVLRARRKAVEFMYAHPDEAGDIVAKVYDLDPAIARQAVHNLTTMAPGATVPYWGAGRFDIKGMDGMIAAQRSVGAYSGTPNWEKMIDRSFLADDLKKDY
ncbi:MAG TPA: ABC transporter substrate-binding protein [Bradyrhizobium sp.]|uniref:ABC transporter substrate-binding protein n=1 Tax=Bradyrhizobium sp. TaxID=376 RepID=UPI002D807312|nr:ABC transporter substrate-binding protein [Bradyrhizobium sp.]HET7886799.1 ABC transporter substrate-binding protein [Bradyrhizobium sp.]